MDTYNGKIDDLNQKIKEHLGEVQKTYGLPLDWIKHPLTPVSKGEIRHIDENISKDKLEELEENYKKLKSAFEEMLEANNQADFKTFETKRDIFIKLHNEQIKIRNRF